MSPRPLLSALSMSDDPLTRAMAPPANESFVDREARLKTERQAKARSDAIDEELKKSQRKGPKPVKIMLLGAYFLSYSHSETLIFPVDHAGQSESGQYMPFRR